MEGAGEYWIDRVPAAAAIVREDGRTVRYNAAAEQLLGWRAGTEGRLPRSLVSRLRDALDQRSQAVALMRHRCRGQRLVIELSAQRGPRGSITVVMRDCSYRLRSRRVRARDDRRMDRLRLHQAEAELRRSEEQLRHSQKMDAVGRLAAGIAHDFNNILTAVHGHVQFLLEDLPPDLPARDDAVEIRRAAERATALTRQLLTFARRQAIRPVPLDLNAVIENVEKLLRRVLRPDITLETSVERVPTVCADRGHMEQVLMNLVVNAQEAITGRGRINIATDLIRIDDSDAALTHGVSAGDYVQLTVSDTGHGMSADVQRQIFEPFFTTKAEGTGLGLSTVYGIVKQTDGHISVYSEPGVGTTFRVLLPAYGEAVEDTAVEASEESAPERTGSVLLVEDDDAVRTLARRTLESRGFTVIEAANGQDALELICDGAPEIDVVVTDLMMPKLGGEDLAEGVLERYPSAGVVLMSGFTEALLRHEGRLQQRRYFLEKPFTPHALVQIVHAALRG